MIYENDYLREISFPVGGIGTGSIGVAGNGRLIDWEIFNRPNKGSLNGFSHIAVRVKKSDGQILTKVLNGDLDKDLSGQYSKVTFNGFGYGPSSRTMCAFEHFKNCSFNGEFPIATITFSEENFPLKVIMRVFNPMIPSDEDNSSIPAAFFEIETENMSQECVETAVVFSMQNPFRESKNSAYTKEDVAYIHMVHDGVDKDDVTYGDATLACVGKNISMQPYWYRGGWQDGISSFWRELSSGMPLKQRTYDEAGIYDTCSVMSEFYLKAGESEKTRFVFSWNVPNNYNYWSPLKDENGGDVTWKNYYAVLFENSVSSALYSMKNWDSLYGRTEKFKNSLYSSTVDRTVIEAISANMSVLKSSTVLRLEDGSFYGWEGVHELEGSCEGTCQHVWNYAYALCFLYPRLERSIRDLEFKYSTYPSGEMDFRLKIPAGREKEKFRACVDGQMGAVLKTYREWKISGDDEWLKSNWQTLKKVIEYAWSEENSDEWDRDRDGVLEGRQHHTLDMELFGASGWLQGFYMAALKAAFEMAEYLGDCDKVHEYEELFQKGYEWTKNNLFNGKYFIQKIDLKNKDISEHFGCSDVYWNDEAKELKYQIGEGCEIDQLCAQWHANILGLGRIFDDEQIKIAIKSLYKNNFKESMRNFANPWRVFVLNDEAGAVMCDYPKDVYKPVIPIPYCEESMHGFGYQLAGLLMSEGKIEEGIRIVKAIRDVYDGKKRNPWNEIECGSNYARSMASFALLPVLSGFKFDLSAGMIGFAPLVNRDNFSGFWALDSVWGNVRTGNSQIKVEIAEGNIKLKKFYCPDAEKTVNLVIDGTKKEFKVNDGMILFNECIVKQNLTINFN